ncbi:MAG: hypothetical protein MR467_01255 [Bacillales bacterium]|nr:hypothetical protein [Mollicutes bacterium]MCI7212764.1 hypothetical protein [Bacillales bacterium]
MAKELHHIDKWGFANVDFGEEILEKNQKALILIAGASSSGKSYGAVFLKQMLEKMGHKACIISLDQYNGGLSRIIPNKVNLNYFNSSIKDMGRIYCKIKPIIENVDFSSKYDETRLSLIKDALKDDFNESDLDKFITGLGIEWSKLNFDEPSVYDLKEASRDIKDLLKGKTIEEKLYSKVVSERIKSNSIINGNECSFIIVEGIYALNDELLDELKGIEIVKNFIDGNPKSLFLRRLIRDMGSTSASTSFTAKLYFSSIMDSYRQTILPSRSKADLVLDNDMSFAELRSGNLYLSKNLYPINSKEGLKRLEDNSLLLERSFQKDFYIVCENEKQEENNILRFRETSFDEGKTYKPASLVHKGAPKWRKDNKIIRPVNVLLDENCIQDVWKDEESCLYDFLTNGFMINRIEIKIKTRIIYKGYNITLFEAKDRNNNLEIGDDIPASILEEVLNYVR